MTRYLSSIALCLALLATPLVAQETATKKDVKSTVAKPMTVTLDADGHLHGKVFAKIGKEQKPVEAKMTLIREGVKVKSVFSDEKGSFNFGNVPPGNYAVSGSAANYVGLEPVVVAPTAQVGGFADNSFVLSAPSYGSVAPAASCNSCSTCGGFVGGGGRLLGNRRLLRLGIIGGIVAVAVSGDDDMSPDGN